MMKKGLFFSCLVLLSALLNGCAEIMVTGAATGAVAAHDRRSIGTFVDDESIELQAREKWLSDEEMFDKSHINFTSINRVVLITGKAVATVVSVGDQHRLAKRAILRTHFRENTLYELTSALNLIRHRG